MMNVCAITLIDFSAMTHGFVFRDWYLLDMDQRICVVWVMYVCDMAHGCVWLTDSCVAHDSCMWHGTWLMYVTWHMTHVCDKAYMCVASLMYVCGMTHVSVWHDTCTCVTWHDLFICVTWLIYVCDMTHWNTARSTPTNTLTVRSTPTNTFPLIIKL